ncbi:hypothetical protein HRR83_003674 [Exophiala dermatitidis]|uniref:Uncharacterized protein n=1 Tax=Exophiala dermatitidis TaxID=5970 RepID=A0AAN6IXB3_EXODE|nr:hypothetical protein HRR74_002946 [Exophiala dermatitidis]KAJ4529686.1 hypothetical protein HRR73_000714 [Exophiala dermatitidis]KAJ4543152.1 hypothetical protein HRR77_005407 [Exophiala dermatitidis]KAJ4543651.1 hypothetical protein HRR76_001715 [Exophiala dermatitidis]KAJ4575115.1 hypothetical protein HRR79_002045 [Exophiala dermatitidis]
MVDFALPHPDTIHHEFRQVCQRSEEFDNVIPREASRNSPMPKGFHLISATPGSAASAPRINRGKALEVVRPVIASGLSDSLRGIYRFTCSSQHREVLSASGQHHCG